MNQLVVFQGEASGNRVPTVLKFARRLLAAAPTGWWCLYCLAALPCAEEILWVRVVDDQPPVPHTGTRSRIFILKELDNLCLKKNDLFG